MSEREASAVVGPAVGEAADETTNLVRLRERVAALEHAVGAIVLGQQRPLRLMVTCLFSRGHALLEGVPGTAKTLLARAIARGVNASFGRVQFTPDLMPSDLLGTHLFDPRAQDFRMRRGPIFTDLLLADEINRTPPKTQAALLEAMEEGQVTVGGETHALPDLFTVFATQNPVEFEGTYPLPEAQLDRFMMRIEVPYPSSDAELDVLRRYSGSGGAHRRVEEQITPVLSSEDVLMAGHAIAGVHVSEDVLGYVQRLLSASRSSDALLLGAGTRAGLHLLLASRTWAALDGRAFVTPDDIKTLAIPVLAHRLILQPDVQVDGVAAAEILDDLLRQVEVPR